MPGKSRAYLHRIKPLIHIIKSNCRAFGAWQIIKLRIKSLSHIALHQRAKRININSLVVEFSEMLVRTLGDKVELRLDLPFFAPSGQTTTFSSGYAGSTASTKLVSPYATPLAATCMFMF